MDFNTDDNTDDYSNSNTDNGKGKRKGTNARVKQLAVNYFNRRCTAAASTAAFFVIVSLILFAGRNDNISGGGKALQSGQSSYHVMNSDRTANYNDYLFHELPTQVKRAANHLGYTKQSWDDFKLGDAYPPVFYKPWDQLTEPELDSAQILGYTSRSWTASNTATTTSTSSTTTTGTGIGNSNHIDYRKVSWNGLPKSLKQSASLIGYNERSWDTKPFPRTEENVKPWNQLTQEQKTAAIQLGYAQQTWNEHAQSIEEAYYAGINVDDYYYVF